MQRDGDGVLIDVFDVFCFGTSVSDIFETIYDNTFGKDDDFERFSIIIINYYRGDARDTFIIIILYCNNMVFYEAIFAAGSRPSLNYYNNNYYKTYR